ncbi:MAG: peptidoglycan DD-metalloendopeptidase family protein, partial [Nitrospinae bacterium]|nr:peptidoglycan DD-metalloendopeptidase family protein [Nitrospinota bacterium]
MALSPFMPTHIPPFPSGSASFLRGKLSSAPATPLGDTPGMGPSDAARMGNARGEGRRLKEVSQEFEALLLSFLFKAMRQTIPKSDFLGKGRDREWYTGLLDLEVARSLARGAGIGLSAMILRDLQRLQAGTDTQHDPPSQGQDSGAGAPSAPAPDPAPLTSAGEKALPVAGRLTSPYGLRPDPFSGQPKFHHGLDIAGSVGTEIHAARAGTVTFSGWKDGYGLTVVLSHRDGYTT